MAFEEGSTFAGYRIERLIGRGGMSVVYLAEHLGLGRRVALKVLASQLARDPRFRERFVRESRVAASIDHPNVIPIYEAGDVDDFLFIAMRYVEGTDLRALLDEVGFLEESRTVQIVRQLAGALDSAHAKGLVHRDVKPGNVLLARTEEAVSGEHVYLSDFGITKRSASDSGITGTGQFVGTLDYAAPEQFEGKPITPSTDVYSLGCVLYECLAGHPPFHRESDAAVMYGHLLDEPPSVSAERSELPPRIDAVIARAIAKKPEDRYGRAGELGTAAADALGYQTPDRHAPAKIVREMRTRRRRFLALAAIGVALAALTAILLPTIDRDEPSDDGIRPGTVLLDLATGDQVGHIPQPRLAIAGYPLHENGRFWVNNFFPASYVQIDPATGTILKEISSPARDPGVRGESFSETPFTVDGKFLWATAADDLVKIDVDQEIEADRFRLDRIAGEEGIANGVAVGAGSVWVSRIVGSGQILRLDPSTGRVQRRFDDISPSANLAFADGSLWAADNGGILRIDGATNDVTKAEGVEGNWRVAAGGGFGWTSDEAKGVVYKVDPNGRLVDTYETGLGAGFLSFDDGTLWVANYDVGTLSGIDAITGTIRTIRVGHPVGTLAAGDGVALLGVSAGRSPEDAIEALTGTVAKFFGQADTLNVGDPATDQEWPTFQVENATCAGLLTHAGAPAPEGWRLQPEVAAAMPTLSADGRTYTFTIRPGFRFSPPENEPVTAETFRHSIERALSPDLGEETPGPRVIDDIEGERAFLAGRAERISGISASGDTLSITLVRPSGDFLERLTLPYFCPVPVDSVFSPYAVAKGTETVGGGIHVPSTGPYYVADFDNSEYVILKRNPNYGGTRPQRFDAIALRIGVDAGTAVDRVQNEGWDGIIGAFDPLLVPGGPLDQRFGGEGSAGIRYRAITLANTEYVAFDSRDEPFSDVSIRRAAALALDRAALAAVWDELPGTEILPPNMPGYEDIGAGGTAPDIERALALMDGRRVTATMPVANECDDCRQFSETVRANLEAIGIDVRLIEVDPDEFFSAPAPGSGFDLFDGWTTQDFGDPATFLAAIFGGNVPSAWLPPGVRESVAEVSLLTGDERIEAAARLAEDLARVDIPIAAIGTYPIGELVSDRIGCRVYPPFGFGLDLVAMCLANG